MPIYNALMLSLMCLSFGSFLIWSGLSSFNLTKEVKAAKEVEKGELRFYRSYRATWRNRLLLWHVIDPENEAGVLKDVVAFWGLIKAPGDVAGGIVIVLYGLFYLLLFLTKSAILNNTTLPSTLWTVFITSSFLACGLGSVIGFWRAKREIHRRVTYADLRQRRLSDYRSELFRWLFGFMILLNGVLLLILPSLLGPQPPRNIWLVAICMGAIYIVGECFLSYTTTLPRLVVTSNPAVAQHADDLLRALVINNIHANMVTQIGFLLAAQWYVLHQWLLSSPAYLALQILMTSLWLLCFLPILWLRDRDKGRLGGRITGWAWNKMAAE